jgi:DNA-binding transcriptional ArsR family regulator
MPPHPLPEPVIELVAQRFRALGEPLRIRLVERLMDGEASVQELVTATGAGQQNVSKHLRVLLHAGIVGRRKQGTFVYYRIVDEVVYNLCEQVCSSLERQHAELGELLATRLTAAEGSVR